MVDEGRVTPTVTQRTGYWIVFAIITVLLLTVAIGLPVWMTRQFEAIAAPPVVSPGFTNYDIAGPYTETQQWADAQAAYNQYVPQNVQVLKGWSTAQIYGYMVSQVSGGLKVSCQHCHNINNFADYNNPNKVRAAGMMLMTADLNKNWLTLLPASVGNKQVTCATCHNGQAVFQPYPPEIQNTQPNDFRLPLDRAYPGGLVVTGRTDKSLQDVELNQLTMYHMNASLGQGCTFCHNARYFPSNEIPQKQYAIHMLNMVRHLNGEGKVRLDIPGVDPVALLAIPGVTTPEFTYISLMRNKNPSCWMCHQGARLPPGSVDQGVVPQQLAP
jgi:photosynthetic reaction center cytochrome c subunit